MNGILKRAVVSLPRGKERGAGASAGSSAAGTGAAPGTGAPRPGTSAAGAQVRTIPGMLEAPATIQFSRFIWSAVVIALLAFGATFVVSGIQRTAPEQSVGLIPLGSLVGGLGLVVGFFLILLLRGRRAGREMLTTLAVIAGIPMLIRGIPGLSIVAVCMLLAAAALWAPASRAFFKKWDPKPPRKRR